MTNKTPEWIQEMMAGAVDQVVEGTDQATTGLRRRRE